MCIRDRTLDQWRKHHKMQTLSAVSCQPSAVSCRSFRARGHAFGAFPALQKHHYLHGFCTADTTSATTTTTHPITLYHIHTPSSRFHHYIQQTPAMYQMCHHHLSDTHNLSELVSLFISHMPHFARSIPITIYTLSSHAPTHHYLHTFLGLSLIHI